jgi:hypothetical protein
MLKDSTYRGHTFQVRASLSEKGWAVQVYENERPISPSYKVTHETATNFATAGWGHAVEALMRIAQSDVEEEHLPEVKGLFHPKYEPIQKVWVHDEALRRQQISP